MNRIIGTWMKLFGVIIDNYGQIEFESQNVKHQNRTVESRKMIYWQHVKSPPVKIVFS